YPTAESLQPNRRELSDVLISSGFISGHRLSALQAGMPPEANLPDFLLVNGLISEEDLCRAISLQCGLPSARTDAQNVKTVVLRSLPAHVQSRLSVVPFRVHDGRLHVAATRAPSPTVFEELKGFTRLPVEFQPVTEKNYQELQQVLRSKV